PERGRFLIIYAYQGQTIEPDITVNLNGEPIASLNRLSTINWTTFADLETEKGDQAVIDARFMNDGGTVTLHNSFGSFTPGFWANQFDINPD
ncbi:MAG: hypothetical protein WEB89_03810, partial [Balneolales bacterium]